MEYLAAAEMISVFWSWVWLVFAIALSRDILPPRSEFSSEEKIVSVYSLCGVLINVLIYVLLQYYPSASFEFFYTLLFFNIVMPAIYIIPKIWTKLVN